MNPLPKKKAAVDAESAEVPGRHQGAAEMNLKP